jgi:capping protein beta
VCRRREIRVADASFCSSPWSNQYFPALDDGFLPSPRLRELEIQCNQVFDVYRHL